MAPQNSSQSSITGKAAMDIQDQAALLLLDLQENVDADTMLARLYAIAQYAQRAMYHLEGAF